jgi:hypothetical protein
MSISDHDDADAAQQPSAAPQHLLANCDAGGRLRRGPFAREDILQSRTMLPGAQECGGVLLQTAMCGEHHRCHFLLPVTV